MEAALTPPAIHLRPYQEAALAAVEQRRADGYAAALLVLPTGSGKTVVFAELARRLNVRTLIVAHREELLTQARDKLHAIWPEATIGVVGAGHDETHTGAQITIASVQALSKGKRRAWLATQDIRLCIVDEAHHAPAPSYRRALELLRAGQSGGALLVGVTATPDRLDGVDLAPIFGDPACVVTLPELIRDGYLSDLRGLQIVTTDSLDGVKMRAGDFAEEQLAAAVDTPERNRLIVDAYQQHGAGRPALVFAAGVQHAQHLAEAFSAAGVRAASLDGTTARDTRARLLADFAAGHIDVLTNCAILTEGTDLPTTSCVILARPTQSRALYSQMVGRGCRIAPGKRDCLVLDIADNSNRHALVVQSLPRLLGRDGYEALPSLPGMDEAAGTAGRGKRSSGEVQPLPTFSVRDALAATRPAGMVQARGVELLASFTWEPTGDGHYRLNLSEHGAEVWLVLKGSAYTAGVVWQDGHKTELSPSPTSLGWAQATAERAAAQIVRGAAVLVDDRSPWRKSPASDKQLWLLRKLKVRVPHGYELTKGEAARLIDGALASKASA